jgi:hypothetical protein
MEADSSPESQIEHAREGKAVSHVSKEASSGNAKSRSALQQKLRQEDAVIFEDDRSEAKFQDEGAANAIASALKDIQDALKLQDSSKGCMLFPSAVKEKQLKSSEAAARKEDKATREDSTSASPLQNGLEALQSNYLDTEDESRQDENQEPTSGADEALGSVSSLELTENQSEPRMGKLWSGAKSF